MAQQANDSFPIDPFTTSGIELATILNELQEAYKSSQNGTSRPAYAVQGFQWLDITSAVNILKMYTGSIDLSILEFDTIGNTALINGGSGLTDTTRAILSKFSKVTLETPLAGDLREGEIVINIADGIIYYLDDAGAVVTFGTNGDFVIQTLEVINASTAPTWENPLILNDIDTSPTLASVGIVGANPEAKLYPNGDIIGSSDNGDFTKYANGNLECDFALSNFASAGTTFTYPIVFIAVPITLPTIRNRDGGGDFVAMIGTGATESQVTIFSTLNGSGSGSNGSWFAKGRYK